MATRTQKDAAVAATTRTTDDCDDVVVVELTLLDCRCSSSSFVRSGGAADSSSSSIADEEKKERIRLQWEELVDAVGCRDAAAADDDEASSAPRSSSANANAAAAKVVDDVAKYVKWQDRYAAAASTLFKSRAYYDYYCFEASSSEGLDEGDGDGNCKDQKERRQGRIRRPIVRLPRTRHNKPYIPSPSYEPSVLRQRHSPSNCCAYAPISVSHHYPYVGIARSAKKRSLAKPSLLAITTTTPAVSVGTDIVVFELPNSRLYPTTFEFVETFRDSFSGREWEDLTAAATTQRRRGDGVGADDESSSSSTSLLLLREFYLRWAVKEAYTKALGLGLGYDFSSFDVVFLAQDDGVSHEASDINKCTSSLWERFLQQQSKSGSFEGTTAAAAAATFIPARVVRIGEADNHGNSVWFFAFQPLLDCCDSTTDRGNGSHSSNGIAGCACTCVGPFEGSLLRGGDGRSMQRPQQQLLVEWTTMESLFGYHTGGGSLGLQWP